MKKILIVFLLGLFALLFFSKVGAEEKLKVGGATFLKAGDNLLLLLINKKREILIVHQEFLELEGNSVLTARISKVLEIDKRAGEFLYAISDTTNSKVFIFVSRGFVVSSKNEKGWKIDKKTKIDIETGKESTEWQIDTDWEIDEEYTAKYQAELRKLSIIKKIAGRITGKINPIDDLQKVKIITKIVNEKKYKKIIFED